MQQRSEPRVEFHFDTNPDKYHIRFTPHEYEELNTILPDLAAVITSKKRYRGCIKLRYTILKTGEDQYFVTGLGSNHQPNCAFLGRGGFGHAKAVGSLKRTAEGFRLADELYVIKKFYDIPLVKIKKEADFFKEVYGIGHLIELPYPKKNGAHAYLLMPKFRGKTPYELDPRAWELSDVCELIVAIYEALSYIHAKNILHGDVSLANVIYDQSTNRAYFIDFGLSERVDDSDKDKNSFIQMIYSVINIYLQVKFKMSLMHFEEVTEKDIPGFTLKSKLIEVVNTLCDEKSLCLIWNAEGKMRLINGIKDAVKVSIKNQLQETTNCMQPPKSNPYL